MTLRRGSKILWRGNIHRSWWVSMVFWGNELWDTPKSTVGTGGSKKFHGSSLSQDVELPVWGSKDWKMGDKSSNHGIMDHPPLEWPWWTFTKSRVFLIIRSPNFQWIISYQTKNTPEICSQLKSASWREYPQFLPNPHANQLCWWVRLRGLLS